MDTLTQTGCELFIRPPRSIYKPDQLGPEKFTVAGRLFYRQDIQLQNPRKMRLECSHFKPLKAQRPWRKLPCVVYVHSNGGSRLEAIDFLEIVLNYCFTYFCFDLSGSGMSDGEYISLGYHEQEDVKTVVQYLQATNKVSAIYLLGRSMGAATSLLTAAALPDLIQGVILDSPFTHLQRLAEEIAANETKAPGFIVQPVVTVGLSYLARQIQKLAGFDIAQVSPAGVIDRCTQPALFLHGLEDTFVAPHHTKELYDRYAGQHKRLVWFHGTHSTLRTAPVFNEVSDFLYHMCLTPKHQEYMGPVSMPLIVAVKTLGSQYFLVKQPATTGPLVARVKPHLVLFVDTAGIQLKLPWMELVTGAIPWSKIFNYTIKDNSIALEIYADSGMINALKFYTPEAQQIGEAITQPVFIATQDRITSSQVPEALDRAIRQVVADAAKKQERIERKTALESVDPFINKTLASPLARVEARRLATELFDEILTEMRLASPRVHVRNSASRPMSPPRSIVSPVLSPRPDRKSPERSHSGTASPMKRGARSPVKRAVSPVKPRDEAKPRQSAPAHTPAAAIAAVNSAATSMAVPAVSAALVQSKNTSPNSLPPASPRHNLALKLETRDTVSKQDK